MTELLKYHLQSFQRIDELLQEEADKEHDCHKTEQGESGCDCDNLEKRSE